MPPTPPPYTVHPSRSLKETSALWYPLIQSLSWNRSLADGPMHYHAALDGQAWLLVTPQTTQSAVSEPQEPSSPEGCIVALPYNNGTGWIGFFLMNDEYRGKGLGGALWRGMDAIWAREGVTTIGLDGVQEQVPTYTRRGFVDTCRIPLMVCGAETVAKLGAELGDSGVPEGRVEDARNVDRELIKELDERCTGLERGRYWVTSDLLDRDDVFGFGYFSSPDALSGLAVVRSCAEGHRIGPLFAPDSAVAAHLLRLAMQHPSITASGGSLSAEIFGPNEVARGVFEKLGWEYAGVEYHRMWYQGKVPEAQKESGLGTRNMFAIFDAGCG